ncbi:hypothetical protein AeMF1_015011, partial [Aphanomyces euteiches]
ESFDQSGNVKKKNKSKKHGQKQKKAIETPSDGANLVLNVRGNDKNTAWFGDSGATIHVCAPQDRHLLHDVAKLDTPRVVQGFGAGDSSATSYIKGSIVVDTPQGRRTITDVHYIPQSAVSLLSLVVLHSKGFDYGTQGKSDLVVSKVRVEALRFRKSGTLYELVGSLVSPDRALNTKDVNEWHRRLGHVSLDSMRKLATASLGMPDLSQQDLGNCDVCAAANLHRQPFNSAKIQEDLPDTVSVDLMFFGLPSREGHTCALNVVTHAHRLSYCPFQ